MTTHELKCWPEFFRHIVSGAKTFELRRDDRGYRAGDELLLREWSKSGGYTGREMQVEVTYLLSGPVMGIAEGWVCMAIRARQSHENFVKLIRHLRLLAEAKEQRAGQ